MFIMQKRTLSSIFFLLVISSMILCKGSFHKELVDTPLKAAIFYFPSPPIMRCLSHSNIPKTLKRALIYRRVEFSAKDYIEQNVTIDIDPKIQNGSKFVLSGNLTHKGEIAHLKINEGQYFDFTKGEKLKPTLYLFGLDDLIGLQRKIHFMDVIGNQVLDYEVFLKATKGKIGKLDYTMELFGQDKGNKGSTRYFLEGEGKLGEDEISVNGEEKEKDYYELNEKYGPVEIFTIVKVFE